MDDEQLEKWVGKQERREAWIGVNTANLMEATLNREPTLQPGEPLPAAWHWLYFHEPIVAADLGAEGHEKLGRFMPPVSFGEGLVPRRMWAAGKLTFIRPIRLGDRVVKLSTIKSITPKQGRSGGLVFVLVEHELSAAGELCLHEEQTIVYREPAGPTSPLRQPPSAPADSQFSASYTPDPTFLFRYSALTFNAHRIHYDVDYCRQAEGYPDLVVHGPLTATLLLDLFKRQYPQREIRGFSYRGVSPLFNANTFTVHGQADGQAWASNNEGGLAMSAQVSY